MDQTSPSTQSRAAAPPRVIYAPDLGPLTDMSRQVFDRILVVDDEPAVREVISEYLTMEGYQVKTAADGREALHMMGREEFDLVVTDLSMPNLDGFGLMRQVHGLQPLTTVIVLSGQGTFENAVEAVHRGAYDFVAKPVRDFKSFRITVDRSLEHKSLLVSRANYQRNLETMVAEQTRELASKNELLKQYAEELESVSISTITTLLTALEEKDKYTAGHSRRVTYYAVGAARKIGIKGQELWVLQTAGQLHDMGKLMIDLSYVNKPGPLDEAEWQIMKQHPAMADRFLTPLPFLAEVRPIIRHHHERMDGSGYPDGLRGDDCDILTQILAVADSFDAMTSQRSYRRPMTKADALAELWRWVDRYWFKEPVQALVDFLSDGRAAEEIGDMAGLDEGQATRWSV
ncbi:MAG: HD domain-containing phosphohydrolase [Thermodesulfobacteriota bacterium]